MAQFDRNSQKENRPRGVEPNFNWRGVILIVIAFSLIAMAMVFYRGGMQPVEDVPYNRFLELLDNKQIVNDKNYPPRNVCVGRRVHPPGNRFSAVPANAVSNHRLSEFHK